jgi:hypothetical protein
MNKRKYVKLVASFISFLLTGVLKVATVFAAELVTTVEVEGSVPNGVISLVQGESANFKIRLAVSGDDLTGNEAGVKVNTSYSIAGGNDQSDTPTNQFMYIM